MDVAADLKATPLRVTLVAVPLALVGVWLVDKALANKYELERPVTALTGRIEAVSAHTASGRSWYKQLCLSLDVHEGRFCRAVINRKAQTELAKVTLYEGSIATIFVRQDLDNNRSAQQRDIPIYGLTVQGKEIWNRADVERQFYFRDYVLVGTLGVTLLGLVCGAVGKLVWVALRRSR